MPIIAKFAKISTRNYSGFITSCKNKTVEGASANEFTPCAMCNLHMPAPSQLTPPSIVSMAVARTSCEPSRCSAYSEDLRWRMVYQHAALGLTYTTVASNLNVDTSTVCRTLQLFRRTGQVTKKQYDGTNLIYKLTDEVQLILLEVVLAQPGMKLHELQAELKYLTGTEVATSTICQFLYKNGFSRQRMRLAASQRDADLRARFVSELSVYKADMFIFVDETGTGRRDSLRRHAYSLRGKPAMAQRLLVRGQRLSSIAIMSVAGVLDCQVVTESVDGDVYYMILCLSNCCLT